ncbi:hypothetical protein B0H12DRAFT_291870 [Mycena haematopus]|nr:hypothetical protein B0H12DRAFT_291870 [Mycena haematopus]
MKRQVRRFGLFTSRRRSARRSGTTRHWESWRSDMDGLLIFAGLFSAILTAFLIESYKTLSPDSGDTTVLLLAQISLQLSGTQMGARLKFRLRRLSFLH